MMWNASRESYESFERRVRTESDRYGDFITMVIDSMPVSLEHRTLWERALEMEYIAEMYDYIAEDIQKFTGMDFSTAIKMIKLSYIPRLTLEHPDYVAHYDCEHWALDLLDFIIMTYVEDEERYQ